MITLTAKYYDRGVKFLEQEYKNMTEESCKEMIDWLQDWMKRLGLVHVSAEFNVVYNDGSGFKVTEFFTPGK